MTTQPHPQTESNWDEDYHQPPTPKCYKFDHFKRRENWKELEELECSPEIFDEIVRFREQNGIKSDEDIAYLRSKGNKTAGRLENTLNTLKVNAMQTLSLQQSFQVMRRSDAHLEQQHKLLERTQALERERADLLFTMTKTQLKKIVPWIAAGLAFAIAAYLSFYSDSNDNNHPTKQQIQSGRSSH